MTHPWVMPLRHGAALRASDFAIGEIVESNRADQAYIPALATSTCGAPPSEEIDDSIP